MSLARDFRPQKLSQIIGQNDITDIFTNLIKNSKLPHSLFFGPAGCGKTTMARAIANEAGSEFFELDAANFKSDDIRKILARFDGSFIKPLIFIDEFHRLSKTQSETLLVPMESEKCIIMGATTENPKFVISSGIRSRMMIFEFKALDKSGLTALLNEVRQTMKFSIDEVATELLISSSAGDARSLLNLLEYALAVDSKNIDLSTLKTLRAAKMSEGANSADTHYELISAMIKSLRGSDIDAAIYYLARLIDAGEDAAFIARRMVIFASEDIGNANPNALNLAVSAMSAVSKIGYPEARIILSQAAIYLASSPKSNSAYMAINRAIDFVQNEPPLPIPRYLINSAPEKKDYLYPHDFGGWVQQRYLSRSGDGDEVVFYKSNQIGFEQTLKQWIDKLKGAK